jgi:thiol-disulfide isomerase/thioredoxin
MNLFKQMIRAAAFLCVVSTAHAEVITIRNQQQLKKHLETAPIVVVEFFSPTCPACKRFEASGIFEQLSQELPNVKLLKISYGDPEVISLFSKHKVHGFPTFVFFKDGKEVETHRTVGAPTKAAIHKKVVEMQKS